MNTILTLWAPDTANFELGLYGDCIQTHRHYWIPLDVDTNDEGEPASAAVCSGATAWRAAQLLIVLYAEYHRPGSHTC